MSAASATALIAFGALMAALAAALIDAHWRRRQSAQLRELTRHLEQAALGRTSALARSGEDGLSRLRDEVDKTINALQLARQRATRAKEGYERNLSNIAHQIKTPVAALSICLQRLESAPPAEQPHLLASARKQLDQLAALQNDLLLIARLDAGAIALHPAEHDLFSLLCIAADQLSELSRTAHVPIRIEEAAPATVCVDEHWFCEAIENILKNCIEHSPVGAEVRVSYASNPLCAEALITDAGPGLAAEDAKRLFERFYTGSEQPSEATGLGLAFAREILELQHGSVRAYPVPDGGTCFHIRLYRHPSVTFAR